MASGELLSPSVMGILGEWGLEDKVRQAGQPLERFIICKENGEEYGSCSLLDPSPGFVGISHYALLAILQHSVSFVQRGVSVSSVKGQPSGQLEVGTTGLGPREKVDVLVGADGVASKVRQLVDASRGSGGEMKASFCNMGTVEAIVQRPPSWEGRNDVVEMWGNGKRLSLMPVSRTHLWISGSFHLPNPVQLGAGPLQIGMIFKRAFQDMEGHGVREAINSLDILKKVQATNTSCPAMLKLDSWVLSPNSVLIGDAAHAAKPLFWQAPGAGLAIEDAHVLSQVLADPNLTRQGPEQALREFESRRRSRVDYLTGQADTLGTSIHQPVTGVRSKMRGWTNKWAASNKAVQTRLSRVASLD